MTSVQREQRPIHNGILENINTMEHIVVFLGFKSIQF